LRDRRFRILPSLVGGNGARSGCVFRHGCGRIDIGFANYRSRYANDYWAPTRPALRRCWTVLRGMACAACPDRFARDLTVQLTGHDFLKSLGIALIPATAPDFFTEDTPTAVLVRQVLGAIAQFEKTSLVAKLKRRATGRRRPRASAVDASHTGKPGPKLSNWRSNCTRAACRSARFPLTLRLVAI
jgi:hypothetical protein